MRFNGSTAHVIAVESEAGAERTAALWKMAKSINPSGRSWILDCDSDSGGIWAGLRDWLLELMPELRETNLPSRHSFELSRIVPELRAELKVEGLSLTDVSSPSETVRNYALDRAFRICQGIVDLIDEWHTQSAPGCVTLACDSFDSCGALVRRFFHELVRRRGNRIGLTLLIGLKPGSGEAQLALFASCTTEIRRVTKGSGNEARPSPAEMRERALALEAEVERSEAKIELRLPELIRFWLSSDEPQNALRWQAFALGMYNHYGFYEDALRFAEPVRANLDSLSVRGGWYSRWNLVGSLFGCYVALGMSERGLEVIETEALAKITDHADLARACYVMAMLHARYLPKKDFALAEEYLERGLGHLGQATWGADLDRHFFTVFLWNGLAFVRHRQGRPQEALELCRTGSNYLDSHLTPDQHRLHRSVLLYNEAQVFASLGQYQEALRSFSAAMEMDPNYSEYYNERGNVWFALGEYDAAVRDYQRAIETSPPYQEVWTNLGQCQRAMGQHDHAEASFARAIDYEPTALLARLGRAQSLDAVGRSAEALAEYDIAILLDPGQAEALSNRAVLRYQRSDFQGSLADLDAAIVIDPSRAELYFNRATLKRDLGENAAAVADFEKYLALDAEALDRGEVCSIVEELQAQPA